MSAVRLSILRIILLVAIMCSPDVILSQWTAINSLVDRMQGIDTSDYIPSFYAGALDYNLMIAASKGYASEIELLIGKGADINAKTQEGATPIIFAVTNNMFTAVQALLYYKP